MRQLTLLMTEKLLCREAKQLASDCVQQSLMVRTKFVNCIFSSQILFPFTSDRFFLLPNEYLLPWIHLMAQGMSFSVLPEPFHSLLLLPGQWRQQLGQSDVTLAENHRIVVPQASCHTGWGSLSLHKVLHFALGSQGRPYLVRALCCGIGRLVFLRSATPWVKAVKCQPHLQVGVLHHSNNTVSFGHFAGNWKHRHLG